MLLSVDGLAASYLDEPKAPMPALRRLADRGVRAQGMITTFPSVTRPAHVSLMTGTWPRRHGIVGNTFLDRTTQELIDYRDTDAAAAVRTETLHDAAHKAGLKTAAVNWPGTKGSESLDWNLPPARGEQPYALITPGLSDELESAGLRLGRLAAWLTGPLEFRVMRDAVFAGTAVHLLKRHAPNLLLVHLDVLDAIAHRHGPHTEEAYWACGDVDQRIARISEALQEPPFRGRSTLFVVADHGFAPVENKIFPNAILHNEGLIKTDFAGGVVERKAWVTSGAAAGVYILDQAKRLELREVIRRKLTGVEGVDRVVGPEEFEDLGLPDPDTNPYQADLMLSALPGYTFSSEISEGEIVVPAASSGSKGTHGQLPDQDFMHAVFVAEGAHVKRGVRLQKIRCVDVAPTIAAILGIEFRGTDGSVLDDILRD